MPKDGMEVDIAACIVQRVSDATGRSIDSAYSSGRFNAYWRCCGCRRKPDQHDYAGGRGRLTAGTFATELNFFGVGVRVECVERDASDLNFFYSNFAQPHPEPELLVEIECIGWRERGFFTSLLANDKLEKRIRIVKFSDSTVLEETVFTDWSSSPSPFPPLFHSTLWDKLASYPGAVLRLESGRVVALIGENYVGKTSVALALCTFYGASLISDSVMFLNITTNEALTFETPLGFRRGALRELTARLNGLDHRLTVSPDTGLVALVKPQDVLGRTNSAGGKIDGVFNLVRSDAEGAIHLQHSRTPVPGWFTNAPLSAQTGFLPPRMTSVVAGRQALPFEIARTINSVETP
ncbi:MAG: hypothetical protein ACOH14_07410 [Rhodoglobus sp.]